MRSRHLKPRAYRFKLSFLIILLAVSGVVIMARRSPLEVLPPEAVVVQPQPAQTSLEAELVTATPTGFEPAEITRPQGRFLLAIDNRSGLDDVDLYLERETGGRVNVSLGRRHKLAWREAVDLPPGAYLLRAGNDESWSCRINITAH